MTVRYHLNVETGETGKCTASVQKCPFGAENHFDSKEEARNVFEESMNSKVIKTMTNNNNNEVLLPADVARDKVLTAQRNNVEISDEEFNEIIYNAYPYAVDDASNDLKETFANIAYLKSDPESDVSIINSAGIYANIIEKVRADKKNSIHEEKEDVEGDPLLTAIHEFRRNPRMPENEGRKFLENCFSNANRGLSENTRKLIFDVAYERASESGWGTVAEEYSDVINLAQIAKNEESKPEYSGPVRNLNELKERVTGMDKETIEHEIERYEKIMNNAEPDSNVYEAAQELVQEFKWELEVR